MTVPTATRLSMLLDGTFASGFALITAGGNLIYLACPHFATDSDGNHVLVGNIDDAIGDRNPAIVDQDELPKMIPTFAPAAAVDRFNIPCSNISVEELDPVTPIPDGTAYNTYIDWPYTDDADYPKLVLVTKVIPVANKGSIINNKPPTYPNDMTTIKSKDQTFAEVMTTILTWHVNHYEGRSLLEADSTLFDPTAVDQTPFTGATLTSSWATAIRTLDSLQNPDIQKAHLRHMDRCEQASFYYTHSEASAVTTPQQPSPLSTATNVTTPSTAPSTSTANERGSDAKAFYNLLGCYVVEAKDASNTITSVDLYPGQLSSALKKMLESSTTDEAHRVSNKHFRSTVLNCQSSGQHAICISTYTPAEYDPVLVGKIRRMRWNEDTLDSDNVASVLTGDINIFTFVPPDKESTTYVNRMLHTKQVQGQDEVDEAETKRKTKLTDLPYSNNYNNKLALDQTIANFRTFLCFLFENDYEHATTDKSAHESILTKYILSPAQDTIGSVKAQKFFNKQGARYPQIFTNFLTDIQGLVNSVVAFATEPKNIARLDEKGTLPATLVDGLALLSNCVFQKWAAAIQSDTPDNVKGTSSTHEFLFPPKRAPTSTTTTPPVGNNKNNNNNGNKKGNTNNGNQNNPTQRNDDAAKLQGLIKLVSDVKLIDLKMDNIKLAHQKTGQPAPLCKRHLTVGHACPFKDKCRLAHITSTANCPAEFKTTFSAWVEAHNTDVAWAGNTRPNGW